MLGKKELVVILVVLICVTLYYYLEYVYNQRNFNSNNVVEGFQMSMSKERKIDEMKKINQDLFTFYRKFLDAEQSFYKNDVEIVNYLITKKYNMKNFLSKPKLVDGDRIYITNPKLVKMFEERLVYLDDIVNNLDFAIKEIDNLKTVHDINNKFYKLFKEILQEFHTIYENKRSYLIESNNNYFNLDLLLQEYNNIFQDEVVTNQSTSIVDTLNGHLKSSKSMFRESAENVEKKINDLLNFIELTSDVGKIVGENMTLLLKMRMNIISKIVVRDLTLETLETIVLLVISGELSEAVKQEKTDAAKKSNKIVLDLIDLQNKEKEYNDEVLNFFNTNELGLVVVSDNEFKYFNTVDKNTNMLQNFCKKIKKVDRPSNSNFLFKRLAKEYVVKKNNQIDKLNKEINQIMGEMTFKEAYDTNLYNLRTSEDAQKQINAIKEAKENIDTIGKFNINLK